MEVSDHLSWIQQVLTAAKQLSITHSTIFQLFQKRKQPRISEAVLLINPYNT